MSDEFKFVKYEKEDGIGILTFNRPEVMNAHNYAMKVEAQTVSDRVLEDDEVQVLIITGAGRGFHTGEDVKDVLLGEDFDKLKLDRLRSWTGRLSASSWTGQVSPIYYYGFGKPVIAAVNGPAVGAGFSIALGADIRIASETAKFGYFYTRRGLLGSSRALTVLVHTIGISRTMEMMLSGELIDAQESLEMGLVRKVVPADQLMDEAKAFARKLMQGAPLAQRAIKASLYKELFDPSDLVTFNTLVDHALSETEDHKEGARAFTEKRAPKWKSR
ncbi:MAG: enoyl-CoA hydratase-related protein [Actinomycetota bacterium]